MSPKRVSETLSPSRPDALAQARGMMTCLLQHDILAPRLPEPDGPKGCRTDSEMVLSPRTCLICLAPIASKLPHCSSTVYASLKSSCAQNNKSPEHATRATGLWVNTSGRSKNTSAYTGLIFLSLIFLKLPSLLLQRRSRTETPRAEAIFSSDLKVRFTLPASIRW